MPNIDFYMAKNEKLQLIQHALDIGGEFIPDLRYPEPNVTLLRRLEDVSARMDETRLFLIRREDFASSPLEMREVVKDGNSFFYAYPRSGGPTVQFYIGPEYEREGVRYLASSFFSYYSWYENTLTKVKEKAPATLIAFYRELATLIRFRCDRIRPGKRTYWVCKEVESDVRSGMKLVGLEDFTPDEILGSIGA